jgi:hypothetical protein
MRLARVVFGLGLLVCGCVQVVPLENLPALMGSPYQYGLLLIDCRMMEKEDKFLAFDESSGISLAGCSILREGGDGQPIQAHILVERYFVFPKLEPGLYCIQSISGGFAGVTPADGSLFDKRVGYQCTYDFPAWNVREVIFEVRAGVPTYLGTIITTEPHDGFRSNTRPPTVTRVGKSELVEIVYSATDEYDAWEVFLYRYPESLWTSALRARLEELSGK